MMGNIHLESKDNVSLQGAIVFTCNDRGEIEECGPRGESFLGYKGSELEKKRLDDLLFPLGTFDALYDSVRHLGSLQIDTIALVNNVGKEIPCRLSATSRVDDDGRTRGIRFVATDLGVAGETAVPLGLPYAGIQAVFDNTSNLVFLLSTDLIIRWANAIALELFPGCVGQHCHRAMAREAADCKNCPAVRAIATGVRCTEETRRTSFGKWGAEWDCESTAIPLKDESGEVDSIVLLMGDVTQCRLRERDLQKRVEVERLTTDISGRLNWVDSDHIDESVDFALAKLGEYCGVDQVSFFNMSEGLREFSMVYEWCADGIEKMIAGFQNLPKSAFPWWFGKLVDAEPIVIPKVAEMPDEASSEKREFESRSLNSLLAMPSFHLDTLVGFVVLASSDVKEFWEEDQIALLRTFSEILVSALERTRVEKALRRSERRLRELAESISDVIWETDIEGTFTYASRQIKSILGYEPEDVIGKSPLELMDDSAAVEQQEWFVNFIASRDKLAGEEMDFISRSGRRVVMKANAVPIIEDSGECSGWWGLYQDVTENKKAEELQEVVSRLSMEAITTEDMEDFFLTMHEMLKSLIPANNLYIALYDSNKDQITFPYFVDERDPSPPPPVRAGNSLTGYVILTGKTTLVTPHTRKNLLMMAGLEPLGSEIAYWLGAPLKSGEKTFGVLAIQTYSRDSKLGIEEHELVEVVASQVALAIKRYQAIASLRRSEEEFRSIFENAIFGIYRTSPEGKFLLANPAMVRMMGHEDYESLAKVSLTDPSQFTFGYSREWFSSELESKGKVTGVETFYKRPDGQTIAIRENTFAVRNKSGEVLYYEGVVEDITEQKKAEAALRESEEKYRNLINRANDGIIIIRDSLISFANRRIQEITGYSPDELIGQNYCGFTDSENVLKIAADISASQAEGAPARIYETTLIKKDGERIFVDLSASLISFEGEESTMLTMRDVTERKVLEGRLSQAQKLEAIGQLAAGIAHEINTPTQYVSDNLDFLAEAFADITSYVDALTDTAMELAGNGSAEKLSKRIEETRERLDMDFLVEEIPSALEQGRDGAKRISSIVKAMKDFSHPGSGEKTAIDLNKSIDSTITVARNEWKYHADVETDFDPEIPLVSCLPGELNQVFLNLIINAAHAIAEKAKSGNGDHKGLITISTRLVDHHAEIRIGDNGGGIPKEVQDRIFDLFFTTKEVGKGTGQGLAISHDVVVKKHGGQIEFESEDGEGATFIVRIPLTT